MSYNPAKNAKESYDLAIEKCREKLESFTKVEIGNCVLYQGDCLEIMPLLPKFDAVVTDPPYGIGADNHAGNKKNGWTQWDKGEWDNSRPDEEVFDLILIVSSHQIIWGGNYFTDYLPPTMQWLVWDKGQRDFSLADCEFAWSSQYRAARIFNYARGKALSDGKEHPTQKPIELMRWCIGHLPKDTQTILDPFMGSGSTGVACVKLGRKFTGIELDPNYFEISCKRIEEAYKQPDFFIEQPKETFTQADIFEGVK